MEKTGNKKLTLEERRVKRLINNFVDNNQLPAEREKFFSKVINIADVVYGHGKNKARMDMVKEAFKNGNNKWVNYVNHVLEETNPEYLKKFIYDLGYEAFVKGTKQVRASREKYGCNIPWLILFDPTSACNMHCKGCWSGTYGDKHSLTFEDMDSIVSQGKDLGIHMYMLTGGEPLVRKRDVVALAEKHNDCVFAIFTNSSLIDRELCEKVQELGNIIFLLSIEGTPETNDSRRGEGHYACVMNAMSLLKEYGIIFGTSVCYTRENIDAVTDENFLRMLSEKGARFGFYFHYMPVGQNAVPELLPTPDQRKMIIEKLRYFRSLQSDITFYPMDFQNDGDYVGGCIAGGRNYFHINSSGDFEPCVFIHFSDSNIHDKTIIEGLQSPLFKAYHEGQPFNRNQLRPCPMLENPDLLRRIVNATGAIQTNEEAAESADELCSKCDDYAKSWAPVADELWACMEHHDNNYKSYTKEKLEHPELAAFHHADGTNEIKAVAE